MDDKLEAEVLPATEMPEKTREQLAHETIAKAIEDRMTSEARPPRYTGVGWQSKNGNYGIFDDGSVRKPWKRTPGVSGRQLRLARKEARRQQAYADRKALAPILALLPPLVGHTHTIGENLQPTCGCTYTPGALQALRDLVRSTMNAGTLPADVVVNPETSEE